MTPQQERAILEYTRLALKNDRESSGELRDAMERIRRELHREHDAILSMAEQLLTERRQRAH